MLFGDWRDVRAALGEAYRALGEEHTGNLPERDWKLASEVIGSFRDACCSDCVECRKKIEFRCEIVCLDCGAPLHKKCAPRHFWPNGRPAPRSA